MRVLALDHGTARIGCAISDPSGTLVTPLPVIEPPEPRSVAELVAEHEVETVVVGLPLHLSGEEGSQAALARTFCGELEAMLAVPVETYDERLTTRMAEASRRAGASAARDSLAAAHLLEGYLASRARPEDDAETTMADDWQADDPFADAEDPAAAGREQRRREREEKRGAKEGRARRRRRPRRHPRLRRPRRSRRCRRARRSRSSGTRIPRRSRPAPPTRRTGPTSRRRRARRRRLAPPRRGARVGAPAPSGRCAATRSGSSARSSRWWSSGSSSRSSSPSTATARGGSR